jgi:Zn finger protein HypA/HybF involved in hydrogenase expression
MDEAMLDGNAVAGVLQDVFAVETTTTVATCGGCGEPTMMAETHVYRGAGFVLRCPHCDNAMVTLVRGDGRMWIGFPGIRTLQVPIDGS